MRITRERPLLLAVDDFHRADEPSAACFSWISRACLGHALLLLASSEIADGSTMNAAAELYDSSASRVSLGNLSDAETAKLLRSVFGSIPNLPTMCDGSPPAPPLRLGMSSSSAWVWGWLLVALAACREDGLVTPPPAHVAATAEVSPRSGVSAITPSAGTSSVARGGAGGDMMGDARSSLPSSLAGRRGGPPAVGEAGTNAGGRSEPASGGGSAASVQPQHDGAGSAAAGSGVPGSGGAGTAAAGSGAPVSTAAAVPSAGCANRTPRPSGGSVTQDGAIYTFPDSYDGITPMPLLLALHAAGNPNTQLQKLTAGSRLATELVRAFPKSSGNAWVYNTDSRELSAQLDQLFKSYCIDTGRVFATGHSSGAQMIVQMLCKGEQRFRAVAPVAASKYCSELPPVAVLYIQGEMDAQRGGGNGEDVVRVFAAANACGASAPNSTIPSCTSTFDQKPVLPGCVTYDRCVAPTIWCSHDDNGYNNTDGRQHGWPCFASDAIADFFLSF